MPISPVLRVPGTQPGITIISAEQTSAPSTSATVAYFQIVRMRRSRVARMMSWSPGTIGRRKRAFGQPALGAQCLVLVVGGVPAGSRDLAGARAQVRDGIAAVLPHARAAGVPLAIEPLHPMYAADRACVNTLGQALDLCDALDPGGAGVHPRTAVDGAAWAPAAALGVALDAYHVWWDPDLDAQVARAGAARLHGFHVCDWLVPTRDLLEDRGMMGDGVIDLRRLRGLVEAAGYRGLHECEIFSSRDWWQRDPDEVLRVMKARHVEHC